MCEQNENLLPVVKKSTDPCEEFNRPKKKVSSIKEETPVYPKRKVATKEPAFVGPAYTRRAC